MFGSGPKTVNADGLRRELGPSGIFTILGFLTLVAVFTVLFPILRPPTVEEVERDIWIDWALLSVDSQGLTITDALIEKRQPAAQQLVETLGNLIANQGDRFVVPTAVKYLRIRDNSGEIFAEWSSRPNNEESVWRELTIALTDPSEGHVGNLEVAYRFYSAGLESLPQIRRLQELYTVAAFTVAILALVTLFAALANLSRIRERAGRLQSQQVTLDLARQMCHELRNGLWAFSLEGKNLRQLFGLVDDFFRVLPQAIAAAAKKVGLDDAKTQRFDRQLRRNLADEHVDPEVDMKASNEMAKEADAQIQSFTRYINLTVEELDRNLLGTHEAWNAETLRLSDGWSEACELLRMRFRSAGVTSTEVVQTEADWIRGDRRALVHIFVNLAKNAVEAMREQPEPREIRFTVTLCESRVHCQVWNRGGPIPERYLPHLFTRGFSTKQGAGRGRGLALVHESVQRLGGSIHVTSTADEGTTFSLSFPQAPAPQEAFTSPSH